MTVTPETAPAPKKRIAFMIGKDRVSFVLNQRHRSYHLKSQQGQDLVALLRADPQDVERIGELADIITYIAKQSDGRVTVDDCDRLRLDGKLIDFGLSGRMAQVVEAGVPFDALSRFIENVAENPDKSVAEDLYRFMEKGNIPLDPEGYILVFKKVDDNYDSFYSSAAKVRYAPGTVVEMSREDCDPNRSQVCSRGLHGCSYEYLNFWYKGRGRVIIGRIHPRDVTAIPADHNDQKLRCCRMEVVGEIPEEDAKNHFSTVVDKRYPPKVEYPTYDLSDNGRLAGGPALNTDGLPNEWQIDSSDPTGFIWGAQLLVEDDAEGGEPTGPADATNDRTPNATTEAALEAVEAGEVTRFDTVDDLMTDLNAPDGPLQFTPPDDGASADADPWMVGRDEGHAFGRQDKANGYPADATVHKAPDNIVSDALKDYEAGYAEGYAAGYAEPADDTLADADGEGRWTLARAIQEGRKEGSTRGAYHARTNLTYDNDPWDADALTTMCDWLNAALADEATEEDHAFVKAFIRAYRDAYHTAWNAHEDTVA